VYDENLHMTNGIGKGFPEPEIPVDDAWKQMKLLLDAEVPNSSFSSSAEKMKGGMGHFLNSFLIFLGVAGILACVILYLNNNSNKSEESTDYKIPVPDGVSAILQNADSILLLQKDHLHLKSSTLVKTEPKRKNPGESKSESLQTPGIIIPISEKKVSHLYSGDDIGMKLFGSTKIIKKDSQKSRDFKPRARQKQGINKHTTLGISQKTGRNEFWGNFHFGLQWGIPLPLQGTDYYFSGNGGRSVPYLYLLPGVWLSHRSNKSEIMLQINPFFQNFTGSREIASTELRNGNNQDTLSLIKKQTTYLHKTFGSEVGLQYKYALSRTITIGAGVGYIRQSKALLQYQVAKMADGVILTDSLYRIGKSSPEWDYLKSGFFTGKLEMAWTLKKFEIGANVTVPFTEFSRLSGLHIKPLNGQMFLRLKIR